MNCFCGFGVLNETPFHIQIIPLQYIQSVPKKMYTHKHKVNILYCKVYTYFLGHPI
jgi:hypothetical protein